MNRIILIGNGFDLAHKMKTSYSDFMHSYWADIIMKLQNTARGNITSIPSVFEDEEIRVEGLQGPWGNTTKITAANYDELVPELQSQYLTIVFKNQFLEILTKKKQELNWVDIEMEYYTLLKLSFTNPSSSYKIVELNRDFARIQVLLETYLKSVEDEFGASFGNDISDVRLMDNIGNKIYSNFRFKDFTEAAINRRAEVEFQKLQPDIKGLKDDIVQMDELGEEHRNIIGKIGTNGTPKDIRQLLLSDTAAHYFDSTPDEILFLSFNYTFTEKLYSDHTKYDSYKSKKNPVKRYIHVHGTTDANDGNNVIFGFGDEIDEDYKAIENLNDNNYLENIKSIKYLETNNYKELLEFLNNGEYQIFIFGHSCGISDRTLLNTLFEHKHCASIKPFYYQKAHASDNYSDMVRNISRNFNSKAVMRDRVVNKEYCESIS